MEMYNYVDTENGLYRPVSKAAPDMLTLLWELSYRNQGTTYTHS